MALFHLSVTQTKRSAGQSAIASAAYRAGERLYSEYYGEYSDYTRKGGVICSDILLPSHAPPEYADRQTLWKAVEKAERGKNAQLAYSFIISAGVLCFDHVSDFSGAADRSDFRSTNFAFSGGYGASCALQTKTSVTRPVFSAFRFPTGTTTKSPTASGNPPVR